MWFVVVRSIYSDYCRGATHHAPAGGGVYVGTHSPTIARLARVRILRLRQPTEQSGDLHLLL